MEGGKEGGTTEGTEQRESCLCRGARAGEDLLMAACALEMQDGVLNGASLGPCWSGRCPPLWPHLDPGSLSGWAAATACPVPPPQVLICPCNHSSNVTSSGKSFKCPLFTLGETISESH